MLHTTVVSFDQDKIKNPDFWHIFFVSRSFYVYFTFKYTTTLFDSPNQYQKQLSESLWTIIPDSYADSRYARFPV